MDESNGRNSNLRFSEGTSFVLYYSSKERAIHRPMATFKGSIGAQPEIIFDYSNKRGEGMLRTIMFSSKAKDLLSDEKMIRHSLNLIVVSIQSKDGFVEVIGENGGGFVFDNNSVLTIAGKLIECRVHSSAQLKEYPKGNGKHSIIVKSGRLLIVICDNEEVIVIGEQNGNYVLKSGSATTGNVFTTPIEHSYFL